MPDRYSRPDDPTPRELRDTVTRALPHGSFTIDTPTPEGVFRVRCRCNRALKWVGPLPSDILLYWLADHDDEMFIDHADREARYAAAIDMKVRSLLVSTWPLGMPLAKEAGEDG